MSVAPEHFRAARLAPPRLPLPAMLGFAVMGFGGALFLAYTTYSPAETTYSLVPASAGPVYEARAVPRDVLPEEAAARAASIARAIVATQSQAQPSERNDGEPEERENSSEPTLLADASRELKGFSRFAHAGTAANSYLALTGASFGMSAQMAPAGFFAPESETAIFAPVPETSTWLYSAALLALVVARGLHATWHRHQRRSASKSDPAR